MSNAAADAADLLASLALKGQTIDRLPDELRPANEAEAMAVQRSYLLRNEHYGWKVGPHPSGNGWSGAPLRATLLKSPATLAEADAASMQIEVEIALVIGRDLPGPASAEDARRAIGGTHLAFELFRSSFTDRRAQDTPSVMADHFNNAGMVLGSGRAPVGSDEIAGLEVTLRRDSALLMGSPSGPRLDVVIESMCWLSGYAAALGQPLRRGDVILTGARIGPLSVAKTGHYFASCNLGDVELIVV